MTSQDVEAEVLNCLSQGDSALLTKVCDELSLEIPGDLAGKKASIYKLIVKHLCSDAFSAQDEAQEILARLLDVLQQTLQNKNKDPVKSEDLNTTIPLLEGMNVGNVQRLLLREFKINGSIGTVTDKDNLTYAGLAFQIRQGKDAKYSIREIQAAVIKAIKPGSTLRNYLESRVDISESAFIKILRAHFKEKDASSVFQEMCNTCQSGDESELDFCMRVMSLRDKVLVLSEEEDCKFEDDMVRKRMLNTIYTGLRHNSVRMALQNSLKGGVKSDVDLIEEISVVVYNETEHLNKLESKSKHKENVCNVKTVNVPEEKKHKENPLLVEIQKLNAKVSLLSAIPDEVAALKRQVSNVVAFPPSQSESYNNMIR